MRFVKHAMMLMLVLGLGTQAQAQERYKKFVDLIIGIQHDEKLPTVPSKITLKGDYKKVASVQYAAGIKTLRFIPKRVGVATLTVHDASNRIVAEYRLDVKKSDLTKVVREIRSLLGDIEGISIKVVNNKVVVDGQILLPQDMNRIFSVVQQFGDKAASIVTLSPLAQRKIAEFIERDINNPEIHVRSINEKFILEGQAESEDEKARAEIIAKMYVPDIIVDDAVAGGKVQKRKGSPVINLIKIKEAGPAPPKKIVQINVHYVELKKDYNRGFRVQWTPTIADGSSLTYRQDSSAVGGVVSTITGTINNLLPKLNWAKEHGHARVLESTSMIVQDGKQGELKSQQQVPYTTVAGDGVPKTEFVGVGINTSVTPSILGPRSDSIQLDMNFQLSALLGLSSSGAPLTSNNSMKTMIVVRSGQSAAIGGLISNNSSTGYNKLPKAEGANPLISLYASKDFSRNQSQFVVFVTPIIKASASQGAEQIKRKFRLRE
jgi:pilus assembly protein CpaC